MTKQLERSIVLAAMILAFGIMIASILRGGRYAAMPIGSEKALKIDKWTGKTELVTPSESAEEFLKGFKGRGRHEVNP